MREMGAWKATEMQMNGKTIASTRRGGGLDGSLGANEVSRECQNSLRFLSFPHVYYNQYRN